MFELPDLPYATDALEPFLSARTMRCHHEKHQKGYVDKLNKLIEQTPYERMDLEQIIMISRGDDKKIYNNAAQVWNHTFFWDCMVSGGSVPQPDLLLTISRNFGSIENLKDRFSWEAKELFGSGWIWLVKLPNGRLEVRALKDAGNPISQGEVPLLTCDVWEHAYYLDFQNERATYVDRFWKSVNWEFVNSMLDTERPVLENHALDSFKQELQLRSQMNLL